jgi:metaxin
MSVPLPKILKDFYALFPLYTYPESLSIYLPSLLEEDEDTVHVAPNPTLCIAPPTRPESSLLSADIQCLKWQAYLALRRVPGGVRVRWDLSPDGAVGGSLPNLYLSPPTGTGGHEPRGELLDAKRIPSWVDGEVERGSPDVLEGYKDEEARDESRAWVSLLEGDVHAALVTLLFGTA